MTVPYLELGPQQMVRRSKTVKVNEVALVSGWPPKIGTLVPIALKCLED